MKRKASKETQDLPQQRETTKAKALVQFDGELKGADAEFGLSAETDGPHPSDLKFHNGSIYRITLRDFVTYSSATIHPGPRLNVIMGPNGSGKSSLVSAIALGLGSSPKVLDRGKKIESFIKHGCDSFMIEIELYHEDGNITVQREVQRGGGTGRGNSNKSSKYKLNGKASNKEEVLKKVRSLNVQLENLCQFLPQERVISFAQLTRPELLKETQRAVGGEEMLNKHLELIKLKKDQLNFETDLKHQQKRLEDMKEQNEGLESEVAKFKEREALQLQIANLNRKKPFVEYEMLKTELTNYKATVDLAKKNLEAVEKELAPIEKDFKDVQSKMNVKENEFEKSIMEYRKKDGQKETKLKQFREVSTDVEKVKLQIENHAKRMKENEKQQAEKERQISVLREEQKKCKNKQEIGAEMKAIDDEIKKLKSQITEINHKKSDDEEMKDDLLRQRDDKTVYLNNLQDERNQKYQKLKKINPQLAQALDWVRNNKQRFKFDIFLPYMEIDIRNPLHIPMIESALGKQLLTIICLCMDDYNVIFHELIKGKKWTSITTVHDPHFLREPFAVRGSMQIDEELSELGVLGTLDQVFHSTPPMKRYLIQNCRLNYLAFGSADIDKNSTKLDRIFQKGVSVIYTPQRNYSVGRSLYGNKERYITNIALKRVDDCKLNPAMDKSNEEKAKSELKQIQIRLEEVVSTLDGFKGRVQEIQKEIEAQTRAKAKWVTEQRKEQTIIDKIKEAEKMLTIIKNENKEQDVDQMRKKQEKLNQDRLKICRELIKIMDESTSLLLENNVVALQNMEFKQDYTVLERKRNSKIAMRDERRREVEDVNRKNERLKLAAQAKQKELEPRTRELVAIFEAFPDTLEEIELLLGNCIQRVNQFFVQNEDVLTEYEQRKLRIAELEKVVAQQESNNNRDLNRITELEATWLPALEETVRKINEKFKDHMLKIRCRGEIRLIKTPDYEHWEIQILVSFREAKELSLLDSKVQSGGEKSVSTMLYLISMHDLTSCPFRLVDEINQGMDQKNERMIFDRVVESSCKPGLPQYFLITPKLLIDLTYHRLITVLCIFNGPWVSWGNSPMNSQSNANQLQLAAAENNNHNHSNGAKEKVGRGRGRKVSNAKEKMDEEDAEL